MGSEAVYEGMNRRILALPLLLLFSGCSFCGTPLLLMSEAAPLAGDAEGLRKFAGQWLDEEGNLIAIISRPPGAQLTIRSPYNLPPKDAQLRGGKIVFRLTVDNPEEVSLELTGKDELQVSVVREPNATCGPKVIPMIVLVRNPSPAWHMKLAARKAREGAADLARSTYNGAMDLLARVL